MSKNIDLFQKEINKVMQTAFALNVLAAASDNELRNLIINPSLYVKQRVITSKILIDQRKQERQLKEIMVTPEYKSLLKSIDTIKLKTDWLYLIDWINFERTPQKTYIIHVHESAR